MLPHAVEITPAACWVAIRCLRSNPHHSCEGLPLGGPLWINSCFAAAMSLGHPAPLRDFDYVGMYYYSLTWCCHQRQVVFTEHDRVNLVRDQILRACKESGFEVIADCYMPDHLHQLVHGRTPTSDGLKFIRLGKQYSGFYFKKAFKQPVWQRYGHDRFLRQDKDVWRIVRYIIENPVRAGLVEKVEDYPFIGSQLHSREELMKWAYTI
jgi:putative transposase